MISKELWASVVKFYIAQSNLFERVGKGVIRNSLFNLQDTAKALLLVKHFITYMQVFSIYCEMRLKR